MAVPASTSLTPSVANYNTQSQFIICRWTHLISLTWQKWCNFDRKICRWTLIWLSSANVAMEIVLTELACWYSSISVKYDYHRNDWNPLCKHKFKHCATLSFLSGDTYQMCQVANHKFAFRPYLNLDELNSFMVTFPPPAQQLWLSSCVANCALSWSCFKYI